jgi:hypothetical protein
MRPSRHRLGERLGSSLAERVDQLFYEGENLTETILHAHLLIERALTNAVAEKLAQPKILTEGQWSFHQKCSLYVGLFDPPGRKIRRLRGFNQLRNAIAHALEIDVEAAVAKYLPLEKERPEDDEFVPENTLAHVRLVAGVILMFDLAAITGWRRDPVDWDDEVAVNRIPTMDEPDASDSAGDENSN